MGSPREMGLIDKHKTSLGLVRHVSRLFLQVPVLWILIKFNQNTIQMFLSKKK